VDNIHVGCPGCEGAEARSKKYTDIPYVDGKVERMQNIVDDTASCHKAGIYRTTDNAA
jgi:C4-type Zn-finger protein